MEGAISKAILRLLPRLPEEPLELASRVEIRPDRLDVLIPVAHLADLQPRLRTGEAAASDPAMLRLTLSLRFTTRGGRTGVIGGPAEAARPDLVLIRALREAHAMLGTDRSGATVLDAAPATPHRRRLVRIAFLAPDLLRAILTGTQPPDLSLARLHARDLPLSWADQRRSLGSDRR